MSRAPILPLMLFGLAMGCAPQTFSRGAVSVALAHPTHEYPVTWSGEGVAKPSPSIAKAESSARGAGKTGSSHTTYGIVLGIERYSGGLPPTAGIAIPPAATGPRDSGSQSPIDDASLEAELERRNVKRHKAFDLEARAARSAMDEGAARARKEEDEAEGRSIDERRSADERLSRAKAAHVRSSLGVGLTLGGAALAVLGGVFIGLGANTQASILGGGYRTGTDIADADTRGQALSVGGIVCVIAGGAGLALGIPVWSTTGRTSADIDGGKQTQSSPRMPPWRFRF